MKEENRKKLGEQVRKVREEQGWTQEQLAAFVGVKEQTIEKIEEGRYNVSLDLSGTVCEALGVNLMLVED